MIVENHPYEFLVPLFQKRGAVFSFSRYVYTPDSLFDERECFFASGEEITKDWIGKNIATLRKDQELALHSKVTINGKSFHIPMIDFSTEERLKSDIFARMSQYLPRSLMLTMAVFNSGRSFHAYSTTLLGPKDWHEFMGRLLLVNPKNGREVVDSRWIGHRLIGGFGSLRWSNNSGQYKGLPTRISFPQ